MLFNGEQEKALHAPCPAIVYGPAGSGKSLVAISMLSQYVHEHRANPSAFPVAYISQSPRLVQEMQRLWQASVMDESLHCLVEFKHYDSLLEEDLDKRTLFRSDTLFKVWYGQLLEDVKVPSLTAATTWFELSQCSHYESDAAYIRDGHSLDAIQRTQLRKLYHAYLQQVCVTDALYQEWFVQLLKKHKKPPLSVDEMWFEFRLCSGYDTDEKYVQLGKRQSSLSEGDRVLVREFYNDYDRYVKSMMRYSPALHVFSKKDVYPLIVVDEAQDNSYRQLRNLWSLAISQRIVFFLGDHQVLFDGKSRLDFLRSMFYQARRTCSEIALPISYRCPQPVVAVANRLIQLKYQLTGGVADAAEMPRIEAAVEDGIGEVVWLDKSKIACLLEEATGVDLAVITWQASIVEAKQAFRTPLVFTPEEIKGLEYKTIVIYELNEADFKPACRALRDHKPLSSATVLHKAKPGWGDESFLPSFNKLITAVTRASRKLVIVQDDDHSLKELIQPLKSIIAQGSNASAQACVVPLSNSLAHWEAQAAELLLQGFESHARDIFLTTLHRTEAVFVAFKHQALKKSLHLPSPIMPTSEHVPNDRAAPAPLANTKDLALPSSAKPQDNVILQPVINVKEMPGHVISDPVLKHLISLLENFAENRLTTTLSLNLKDLPRLLFQTPVSYALTSLTLIEHINHCPQKTSIFISCLVNNLGLLLNTPLASLEQYLLKNVPKKQKRSTLVDALCELNVTLKTLEKSGINLKDVIGNYRSLAFYAAGCGNMAILTMLAKYKADFNLKTILHGIPPLYIAVQHEHVAAVALLLEHKADPNGRVKNGATAALMMAQVGNVAILKLLVKFKADFNLIRTIDGATPLIIAAQAGSAAIVALLLEQGANPNSQMNSGATAALAAAQTANVPILELLAKAKADFNIPLIPDGITPLISAVAEGSAAATALLLQHGADPNAQMTNGGTATFIANEMGHHAIIKLLAEAKAVLEQDNILKSKRVKQSDEDKKIEFLSAKLLSIQQEAQANLSAMAANQVAISSMVADQDPSTPRSGPGFFSSLSPVVVEGGAAAGPAGRDLRLEPSELSICSNFS